MQERRLKEMSSSGEAMSPPSSSAKTNPFLSSPCEPTANQKIIDLFSAPPPDERRTNGTPASEDLLGLGGATNNPFADSLFGNTPQKTTTPKEKNTPFGAFTNGEKWSFKNQGSHLPKNTPKNFLNLKNN